MSTFSNILSTVSGKKVAPKFYCAFCDYKCFKKYNWDKHITTSKHILSTEINVLSTDLPEMAEKWQPKPFCCEICKREYKDRSGLWRHKNKGQCATNCGGQGSRAMDDKDLIEMLIKQNTKLMGIIENGTNNTNNSHNTTHTNSHNKAFNLNFFLNETCKNAMNITDFVESIKLQLSDLMNVGELGYVEGISNIIIKNLNNLDETERPIHCTDKKRETFYVKDQGQWEKDDQERKKIKRVISNVAFKNEKLLQIYKAEHPGCNYSESKYADEYSKLVIEAMGGSGNDNREKEEKIIRNISKATVITDK